MHRYNRYPLAATKCYKPHGSACGRDDVWPLQPRSTTGLYKKWVQKIDPKPILSIRYSALKQSNKVNNRPQESLLLFGIKISARVNNTVCASPGTMRCFGSSAILVGFRMLSPMASRLILLCYAENAINHAIESTTSIVINAAMRFGFFQHIDGNR